MLAFGLGESPPQASGGAADARDVAIADCSRRGG